MAREIAPQEMKEESMNAPKQAQMEDPTKQYEQPDIPKQTQPEPGLDSKLKPQADHGIDTYEGAGRLKGRKTLVTGGDSGIGRAVAVAFAREGADVAISYLPAEEGDAKVVQREIEDAGQKAVLLPGDVMDEIVCRNLVQEANRQLGGLDVVVNNAAKQVFNDDFATLPSDQLVDTFATNVFAMFWISQEALKFLPKGGTIINTTSIVASQPSEGLIDYAATKGAISTFTKALSMQLAPKGIRVNAVAPGPIWTPLQPSHGQSQEKMMEFGADTPLGRAGQPAELAPAYVFLASQEASYISGQILGVTGGRLM